MISQAAGRITNATVKFWGWRSGDHMEMPAER